MSTFLTGATGYLGSYLAFEFFKAKSEKIHVLVRAKNILEAKERLWHAWQLHLNEDEFHLFFNERVSVVLGDLHQKKFGLDHNVYKNLVTHTTSILHCAASLNRKSEKSCMNTNFRGSLHVILFAKDVESYQGLRKFSAVSTVAVAGERKNECVLESEMIDWSKRDYDPYARTKKMMEVLIHELLPDVPKAIFRPSIVMGDSQKPKTTQFDMVKAFVWLSQLKIIPFEKFWKADIVNADFVSQAIFQLHQKKINLFAEYNISSGEQSESYESIVRSLAQNNADLPIFLPFLEAPSRLLIESGTHLKGKWGFACTLLNVFWPYLTFNTVFDNSRVREEIRLTSVPFSQYAKTLKRYAMESHFKFNHSPLEHP